LSKLLHATSSQVGALVERERAGQINRQLRHTRSTPNRGGTSWSESCSPLTTSSGL
jgi:hypothetical protein